MPANIEQMFSVREVPWHREGHVLEDYPQTFEEARKLAGLDWDPVERPAFERLKTDEEMRRDFAEILATPEPAPFPVRDPDDDAFYDLSPFAQEPAVSTVSTLDRLMDLYRESLRQDPDFRRIARSDDLAGPSLSYARDSYNIIPNSAFGEIIDSITEAEPGKILLETGGCLAQGRAVWMLARLDEPIEFKGDKSLSFPYLGITSRHDGKAACSARLTTVRIVCANTLALAEAEGERTGAVYSFSHRGNWRDRIGEAREALSFAREETAQYIEVMTDLLGINVTAAQEELFIREFIPSPPDGIVSDRVARNIEEARAAVLGFLNSPTVDGSGVRGTAYGLVQAAGEYLDHARRANSWETRMNRSLLTSQPLKAKAAVLAREVALADA